MLRLLRLFLPLFAASALAAAEERRVVLLVWDGMRPDFIGEKTTPNLHALARRGVFFNRHHPAYPSMTEVNGTVLATGTHPRRSGIVANREYRPALKPLAGVDMQDPEIVERGDAQSKGHFLLVPTLAELLHEKGIVTAIAGTKGVNLLLDRPGARRQEATTPPSINIFMADVKDTMTNTRTEGSMSGVVVAEAREGLEKARGRVPSTVTIPNQAQDEWTTATLTEYLWRDEVPRFSALWLSDPDYTQHAHSPGSPQALRAIANSDRCLGRVVEALEKRGLLATTDILVVSDHGFSSIERNVNVAGLLQRAGVDAQRQLTRPLGEEPGKVLVVGNGGSVLLYVAKRDPAVARKAVEFLQTTDWCGVIFTREKMDGTFPLSDARLDSPEAPDVVFSLRWNDGVSPHGTAGMIITDGLRGPGNGTHASLSRFDMRNTLVAGGPGFRPGLTSETPSGNVDVVATILHLLGIKPAATLDGRVLAEALAGDAKLPAVKTERREASRRGEKSTWKQYLQVTTVGGSIYFDEGNAAVEAKP